MENVKELRLADPPSWIMTLATLLPLWLLSLAVMAEGFPHPPISIELAVTSFVFSIAAGIMLMLKGWMPVELFLYSFLPFTLLYTFDEISTSHKTPFILLCTLILTAGAVVHQRGRPVWLRWLFLLSAAVLALAAASHAANAFWNMISELGYVECFPDFAGCAPLNGQEPSWLALFFSF